MLDSSLWEFVWYEKFEALKVSDTYKPIPPVDVPITFDNHLIAVLPASRTALPTWVTAGWINQRIPSGIINRIYPDADLLQNKRVVLGRVALLSLPKLTPTFAINYVVPRWFLDIHLTFWKYKEEFVPGSTIDSVEEVKNTLLNIERTLDRIRREQ